MGKPKHGPVTADAFLRWIGTQTERFELVDGWIVRMMTGARQGHNVVTLNLAAALLPQAKRHGCRTTANETAVRIGPGAIRYPDVVVDCGPRDPNALEASRPTMVVEVASPRTSTVDATSKLEEYRSHPDIRLILLIEPDIVSAKLYRRDGDGDWTVEHYNDLGQVVSMPEIGAELALADVYDTLNPVVRPRLRLVEEP